MTFKIWIALLFVLLLTFAINNTINVGVTAEDWNRHSVWIANDIKGNWTPLSVYPPAFHLMMIPPVLLLGNNIAWFQVIFASLVNLVLLFIVHKYHGQTATLAMAIIMLSSLVYMMYYDSLTPQTVDIMLFPFFMYFILKGRPVIATSILILIGYLHNYGIIFYLIATIYLLTTKREYLKFLVIGYIFLTPMIIYSYIPLADNLINHRSDFLIPDNRVVDYEIWATDETIYYEQPLNLLIYTGFTFPMLIYAAYRLFKDRKAFKLTDVQKFYIIWAVCFIPTMYFSIFRAISFMVVPIMLLTVSSFRKEEL